MQTISFKDYLEIDAVSRSDLIDIGKSVKYYNYVKNNGKDKTPEMIFGNMLHTFVLEPYFFDEQYFISKEKIDRRTKDGKALYAKMIKSAGDKEIVSIDDYQKLIDMRWSLFNNELIRDKKLLENIEAEKTFVADMPSPLNSGIGKTIKCKVRPDVIKRTEKNLIMADLKSCCSLEKFNDDVFKRGYHIQAAFYLDVYFIVTGEMPKMFLFIAIEKENPYLNKIFRVDFDSETIYCGRLEYKNLLAKYETAKNIEFVEHDSASLVEIPAWYKYKIGV